MIISICMPLFTVLIGDTENGAGVNSMGPRHDPCGTPWLSSNWSDNVPLMITWCDLDCRQEEKQFGRVPDTPKEQFTVLSKSSTQ